MSRVLAILAGLVLAVVGLVMLFLMINVSGLSICEELGKGSLSDECIEASSGERVLGLVAGWLAVAVAALGVAMAVRYTARRTGGRRLTAVAVIAPILSLTAIWFLPISF